MKTKFKTTLFVSVIVAISVCVFSTCTSVKVSPEYGSYPSNIGKIFVTTCAVSGCHNDVSKAAGLSFQTWNSMFEGSEEGACVIPYRHDFSSVCYHINTYSDLGTQITPTMPNNGTPLSHEDVKAIEDWIDSGAPNEYGVVKFSDNPHRRKLYVTNQACDVVTVFDAETLLQMRYITVGNSPVTEAPHNVKVSNDGKYWYVVSTAGNSLQKYKTSDDSFVGEAILGGGRLWNTVTISSTGDTAFVVDWESSADIAVVNLNTFAVGHNIGFNYPHGSCMSPNGQYLYVSQNSAGSDQVYKILVSDFSFQTISLYSTPPSTHLNSHEIIFSKSGDRYFVTCQGTSEVRVMDAFADTLITIIPVGEMPSEMAVSSNFMFVTCQDDILSFPGEMGSVYAIDISGSVPVFLYKVYTGHQPHGIAVDEDKQLVMVANRNQTAAGPPPHHPNSCGGRNGYVTFIDMNTHELLLTDEGEEKEIEVSADPYSIAITPRH